MTTLAVVEMRLSWDITRDWFAETWAVLRTAVNETLQRHPWWVIAAAALGPILVGVIFLGVKH